MRASLLYLLFFLPVFASAQWTGVALEIGNFDSQWEFGDGEREARFGAIDFQIEDKTAGGLRVGAVIGYMDLRLVPDGAARSRKFDGQYIGVYLRQPWQIGKRLSLHAGLDLRYYSGDESGEALDAEIDWTQTRFEIGAGVRLSNLRIMPFASYQDIDGDISDEDGSSVFEQRDAASRGIRFDYFVEPSAFVRLEIISGGQQGGYLTFARRY